MKKTTLVLVSLTATLMLTSCGTTLNSGNTIQASSHTMVRAKNHTVIPSGGVFKAIDVDKQNKALRVLTTGNAKMKSVMKDIFFENQNKWYPPVMYALSHVLFEQGHKDDAAMWFYIGQLRARIDANICRDKPAREAVSILNNRFGPLINQYALKDTNKLEKIVDNAIKFVRTYEGTYDHRWINLHSMSHKKGTALSYPKKDWPAIKKKTIDKYYADFKKYVLKK